MNLTLSPARSFARVAALMSWAVLLYGCAMTSSEISPRAGAIAGTPKPADTVQLLEGDSSARPYQVVADITAKARPVTYWFGGPARGDVDAQLREQAAKLGADAVIQINYRTEPVGVFTEGQIIGSGVAIIFKG